MKSLWVDFHQKTQSFCVKSSIKQFIETNITQITLCNVIESEAADLIENQPPSLWLVQLLATFRSLGWFDRLYDWVRTVQSHGPLTFI